MYKDIDDNENDVVSTTTEFFPSHFLFRIKNFSLFSERGFDKYESAEFKAGGSKWRLIIHPNGNVSGRTGKNISVYLSIVGPSSVTIGWEVSAMFGIFLRDQISEDFLCMRGKNARTFKSSSPIFGFSKFISQKKLTDPCNGYLVNDACLFGAEVFVLKKPNITNRLSLMKSAKPYSCSYQGVSELKIGWRSENFTVADQSWNIQLRPSNRSISIYLYHVENDISSVVKANYTFRIKDVTGCRVHTGTNWFGSGKFSEFKPIAIVDKCYFLEVELTVLAVARTSK